MTSSLSFHILHISLAVTAVGSVMAAEGSPLDIRHDKQLFIDDYIIESLDGASKKLNQPTKYNVNPVLPTVPKSELSWEAGMLMCFTTILFDDDERLYKMWYSLYGPADESTVLAYATSRDGITWHKPSLGIVNYLGSKENNIILDHDALECGVFKDPHETDPAKKFKMLSMGAKGVRASYSADGVHWTYYKGGEAVVFHSPGHDSQSVPYWDNDLGKYVAIIRDRTGMIKDVRKRMVTDPWARETYGKLWGGPKRDRVPENHSLRRVGQVESEDFVNWTPMRTVVAPDDLDPLHRDQFYNMQVMLYEGLRVGLLTVFSYDYEHPRGAVQLTYSRDGMNWHRGANREVFLPMSDWPGDFDWGFVWPVQGPLLVGDEIWIYYVGWGGDHNSEPPAGFTEFGSGLGLAKLRLDGFVSVDAVAREGTLTTKTFTSRGKKLVINADAGSGWVLVEILNADGKPMAGFTKRDCDPLKADKIRHSVTWNGKSDVKGLEGKAIKLKFYLETAKLFSFRFRDDAKTENQTKRVSRRKRRVIFNDDSESLYHPKANTPEGFLAARLKPLAKTGVTTISWNCVSDAVLFKSEIQPIWYDALANPPTGWILPHSKNLKALIEAGHCPLQIVSEFAHDNGMEVFAAIRMNDVHDSFTPIMTKWKKEHPELLVSSKGKQSGAIEKPAFAGSKIANLYATAQDYSHRMIRDRKFEIIEEVCQTYDIDGVELDFIRHPVLFKSVWEGHSITKDQIQVMTTFLRRIRTCLDEAGEPRGRPLLLAARVPDDFDLSLNIGLDLRTWLQEGLLDILIAGGGYAPFGLPVEELVRVAHSYDVPVYPCINNPGARPDGQGLEVTRALATKWYSAGSDGVYFWNMGTPFVSMYGDDAAWRKKRQEVYACLYEVGDPQAMEGKDKLYAAAKPAWFPYAFISSEPDLPVKLEKGEAQQVPLTIGDDVGAIADSGTSVDCELKLELKGPASNVAPLVRLNGTTVKVSEFEADDAGARVRYSVEAPLLRKGKNIVEVSLHNEKTSSAESATLDHLQLQITFPASN